MLFSSTVFVFLFLPILLLLTFVIPARFRNILLLFASIFYYAWGGISFTLLLIGSITLNYFMGRLIGKYRGTKRSVNFLTLGITINILLLAIFKYGNFTIDNYNVFANWLDFRPVIIDKIYLPLGISFFTFQAISYLVDVYRREVEVQKNLLSLGLFISLFPQLIIGPILRYKDIGPQLRKRKITLELFTSGVKLFILGLGKKVLIANALAIPVKQIFDVPPDQLTTSVAWAGIVFWTLQLYFDFSGYSDMAIGLGRMFGFKIKANFNFPYISRSISEFWRRWHISLGAWFRNYLYIPLGGNRVSPLRVYFNLFTVFLLMGWWHGASWNMILFGLIHGIFLIIERTGFGVILKNTWRPIQHSYTMIIFILSAVLFKTTSLLGAGDYYKSLFGLNANVDSIQYALEYISNETAFILIIAILSSTRIWVILMDVIKRITIQNAGAFSNVSAQFYKSAGVCIYLSILLLSMMYLASDTYNPFIYFQF